MNGLNSANNRHVSTDEDPFHCDDQRQIENGQTENHTTWRHFLFVPIREISENERIDQRRQKIQEKSSVRQCKNQYEKVTQMFTGLVESPEEKITNLDFVGEKSGQTRRRAEQLNDVTRLTTEDFVVDDSVNNFKVQRKTECTNEHKDDDEWNVNVEWI